MPPQALDLNAIHVNPCRPILLPQALDLNAIHVNPCHPILLPQALDLNAIHVKPCCPILLPQALDLNAIHVNPCRPWLFAVGGDDQYARVYDLRAMRNTVVSGEGRGGEQRPSLRTVVCEPVRRR